MEKSVLLGLVIGGAAVTAAGAYAGYEALDRRNNVAEVLAVEPVLQTVRIPRQVCNDEAVTRQAPVKDPKRVTGTVLGAVAGGVLGNQIGGGSGKTIATVAGAAAGGYAGSKVQKGTQERNTYQDTQQRCTTVYDSVQEQNGFDVRYLLDGRESVVRMDHDPGATLPVENGQVVVTRSTASDG